MTHTYIKTADKDKFETACTKLGLKVVFEVEPFHRDCLVAHFRGEVWRWAEQGGRAITLFGEEVVVLEKDRSQDRYVTYFPRTSQLFEILLEVDETKA